LKGAGIRELGGQVQLLDLPEPNHLRADEIAIDVKAAGVANWDDIVRIGAWDVGIKPPMALGVEASGSVRAVGYAVKHFRPGDEVMTHALPLRHQGAWAERFVAPEEMVAAKPSSMSWEVAGAFPVPALIAYQVLTLAVALQPGESVLINGGGGVTGGVMVAVAAALGARVITTAGSENAERLGAYGAGVVVDYRHHDWVVEVRQHIDANGVSVAVNAVRGAAATLMPFVADGGRLATITGDPPDSQRGITVSSCYVSPDGDALAKLSATFTERRLTIPVTKVYALSDAYAALAAAVKGAAGAVLIDPTKRRSQ
jgi:NADPH:quinone reductase-like Zn-dependent oxidoreductase